MMPLGPRRSGWSVPPLWTKFGWRFLALILQIIFMRGVPHSFREPECGIECMVRMTSPSSTRHWVPCGQSLPSGVASAFSSMKWSRTISGR